MMARMMDCGHPFHMLNIQYRMHPDISIFPNSQFYKSMCVLHYNKDLCWTLYTDKIQDGDTVRQPSHGGKWHEHSLFPTYAFFDFNGVEQRDPITFSLYNTHEVNAIGHLLSNLLKAYPGMFLSWTQRITFVHRYWTHKHWDYNPISRTTKAYNRPT